MLVDCDKTERTGEMNIEGYFSLSNRVIRISSQVSKSKKKKLCNGIKSDDEYMHFILIGQLGKYIDTENSVYGNTSMKELLDFASSIIYEVKNRIVCSNILLECRKPSGKDDTGRIKLHQMYQDLGFQYLQESDGLIQYYFRIK